MLASPTFDPRVLDAVARILDRDGIGGLTISAVAQEAGLSRVTLHRHGLVLTELVIAVLRRASDDLRESLWPVMTTDGPAAERLSTALEVLCRVSERHSGVLSALFRARVRPLPEQPGRTTSFEFIEPFERLLRDGLLDGSLRVADPVVEATLLANATTWTYLHMRQSHGWAPEETTERVLALVMANHLPVAGEG